MIVQGSDDFEAAMLNHLPFRVFLVAWALKLVSACGILAHVVVAVANNNFGLFWMGTMK